MEPPIRERVAALLAPHGVDAFGVCALTDCLPLLPCRAVSRVPAGARSVIVCLFPYPAGDFPARNVARYAVLPDYHTVVGEILDGLARGLAADFPGEAFAPFVDNSPFREVRAANRAGLGAVGRHGQLIHPGYGGRLFIGEVATTLDIPADAPSAGGCLDCGRCVAACPTGALQSGEPLDKSRCRSHITQKKGRLSPWETEQIRAGGLAWGCDRCVDACPLNTNRPSPIAGFARRQAPVLTPANLDDLRTDMPYGYRGRAVLERNLAILAGEYENF